MLIEIVVRMLGRTYLNLSLDLSQARIPNNEIKQILEAIGKRSNKGEKEKNMEDIRSARKKSVPQSVKLTEDELDIVSGGEKAEGLVYDGGQGPKKQNSDFVACPGTGGAHVWYHDMLNGTYKCVNCPAVR